MLDTYIYILRHHDRVVYHQTDREHDRQHRQYVDGESGDIHHEESSYQRYGDNDDRNQRDPPVAEEQEDNQYDQEESLVDRLLYLADRGPDKAGVVIHHLDRDIFRQVFL